MSFIRVGVVPDCAAFYTLPCIVGAARVALCRAGRYRGGGAIYLMTGLLSGIVQARVTGCGAVVDAAIGDGAAPVLNLILRARQNGLVADVRGQSIHDCAPFYGTYVCANGHDITLGALEPQLYALLLDTLGLADGPKTRTYAGPQWNKTAWPARHARTGRHCCSPLMSALAPCSVPWKPLLRPGMTRQGLLGL